MKTAILVKNNLDGFNGHAALYKLSEPLSEYSWGEDDEVKKFEHVVCSTAYAFGVETYIFGADEDGNVIDWGDLPGSLKGTSCHIEALRCAGYSLEL